MDGHSFNASIARIGSEDTSSFLCELKEYWFRELYLDLKVTASFDRSESYTRVIDGQARCITPEAKPQNLQIIWNVQFITVFVPAWMIPPVYHSLRRESIKTASSASPIGVQSVRPTWFEDTTPKDNALVRVLCRLLTPIGVAIPGPHDEYMRDSLLPLAAHGDGYVLTVAVALLLTILTGRSDLCIADVFGAGKTRSLAVLLIALSCELSDFYAIVYTKENVAAKVLADQISDLAPPIRSAIRRLLLRNAS